MFKIQKHLQVVAEVGDGFEAVQKAEDLRPDLVLLDIGLPRLNGLEAASRIRQVTPDARILFVSQSNDADVIRAAMSNGAVGFVLKAEAGHQLLPAIEAALRGERFVSERLED